jgi:hypothetical protein
MGPMIAVGLPKLRVLRQTERGTKQHKGWPAAGTTRDPIEGTRHPQALYLSLDQEVSFTPLHVCWHLAVRVLSIGITGEHRMKPPHLDLQ